FVGALFGLGVTSTRRSMLQAQIFQKLGGGPGASCLHVFICFLHSLYGFGVVLLFLVKIGCENIIERGGGVLAVPSGVLFQLGLTFRLEGYHRHALKVKISRPSVNGLALSRTWEILGQVVTDDGISGSSPKREAKLQPMAMPTSMRRPIAGGSRCKVDWILAKASLFGCRK